MPILVKYLHVILFRFLDNAVNFKIEIWDKTIMCKYTYMRLFEK